MTKTKYDLNLPFDQFSRQLIVRTLADGLRHDNQPFRILDVGGYKGKSADFFQPDTVIALDVEDIDEPNYVKGDGTNLGFEDDSFDIVCSFDVLEHISKSKRERFISESLRVAKYGVFLACPFDNSLNSASYMELQLNKIYKQIHGTDHRWLKEHIDNGLPTENDIEAICSRIGALRTKMFTNKLENWALMQEAIFLSTMLDGASLEVGELNKFYNKNLSSLEAGLSGQNSYRVIYFISKDSISQKNVKAVMRDWIDNKANDKTQYEFIGLVLDALMKIYKQKADELKSTHIHDVREMRDTVKNLNKQIKSIEQSASWKITKPLRLANSLIVGRLDNRGRK